MAQLAAPRNRPNEPNNWELALAHSYGHQFTQAHQQRDHLRPIDDFLQWLRKNQSYSVKDPQSDERAAFVPISAVTTYLEEDGRLEDILDALFHPDEGPEAESVLPNYVAIFCILIETGKGTAVEHFVKQGLSDQHLPFDAAHIPTGFPPDTGDGTFYRRFCDRQWKFWVPDLERSVERNFLDKSLLPIIKKREVARGGSATLYEVKVHSSYNKLRPESCPKDDPNADVFAIKTYHTSDAAKYYETEVDAFRKLKRSQPHNPHLIAFFGSYIYSGTYNIILEYADQGSLEQYFQTIEPPFSLEDISKVWVSLFGVLKGLESIHKVELAKPNAGSGILNGWHQDVKPKNILVFSNNASSPYEFTFKLADLGLSHFQKAMEGEAAAAPDSFGTSTYGAPECYRQDRFWDYSPLHIKQDVDIWSVGCIYSEVAVWMARSSRGLQEYRDARFATTLSFSQRLGDAFHDGEKVLDAVTRTHLEILPHLRSADCVTRGVLEIVDRDMLQPADRLNTRQLWIRFTSLIPNNESGIRASSYAASHNARQISYQSRPSSRGSINPQSQYSPPHPPPPPPGSRPPFTNVAGERRTTDPKMVSGISSFQQYYPRHTPSLPYPRASSPDMMTISEHEGYAAHKSGLNGPYTPNTYPEAVRGYTTAPSRAESQFGGPLGGVFQQPFGAHGQTNGPFPTQLAQNRLASSEDPFIQQLTSNSTQNMETDDHERSKDQRVSDRPGLDYYYTAPTTFDGPQFRGGELGTQSKRPISHTPQTNQRPQVGKRPHSLPASQLPLLSSGSSHEMSSKSSPLSTKRSPPDSSKQRKKRRRSTNLPHLSLAAAIQWRANKKESQNWKNRLRKKELPRLPDDWLMHKCHKRDHVFIIDDAASMKPHWEEMCTLFGILAYIVKKSDHDGIDMYFTMSETRYNNQDTSRLIEIVTQRKSHLEGQSSINVRLQQILGAYNTDLMNQIALRQAGSPYSPFREIKPLSVYVFTDGVWTPKCDPQPVIENIVDSLEKLNAEQGQVGVQFISFGHDKKCLKRLERYDKGLNLKRDIVDHCPSTEGLWKMIFGAIDPEFDEAEPTEDSDSDQELNEKDLE